MLFERAAMNAPETQASQQVEPTGIKRYSNFAASAAATTRSHSSAEPATCADGTPYAVVSPWVGRYQPNSRGRIFLNSGKTTFSAVMRGLDPRIHLSSEDGLPGQAR